MAKEERRDTERWADVVPFPTGRRAVPLRKVVGEVLREERRRQERTLADVAEEAAVSLQYLSEVERGRKEVSSDLLTAIHLALGLELGDVLERAARRLRLRSHGGGSLRMLAA
ncbi:MAG TPA: helix-turn-helix transcriptional regulator [Acidimicrobiales bacterium]|nr:helix-turn-helix transcriptional regulator [Acidimicrobiales bacterium]